MKKALLLAAAVIFLGAGCIQVTGTNKAGNDGGLWSSTDKGAHWVQKASIATVGAPRAFATANITRVAFDPSDAKAVYAGTEDRGLMYSYDTTDTWREATTYGAIRVNAVVISPTDKCTSFVATGNRIVRSRDCLRTSDNVYVDTRGDASVTDLAIDFFNASIVWASTSAGDLIKSTDNGATWSVVKRFDGKIRQILMSPADSRTLWISVEGKSIWKTTNAGASWIEMTAQLKEFGGIYDTTFMAEDRATSDALIVASRFGIVRTTDGGTTWKSIPLLTPSGSATIFSLVVNPKNSKEIWYGTGNTLYHSVDGGAKWNTTRLPTTRAATGLFINPANPNALYLGTTLIQPKKLF